MNAHTPGPWGLNMCDVTPSCTLVDGDGFVIADAITGRPYEAAFGANARLIAAAPDLLAALRVAADCMPLTENYKTRRDLIAAAIAKATGATS